MGVGLTRASLLAPPLSRNSERSHPAALGASRDILTKIEEFKQDMNSRFEEQSARTSDRFVLMEKQMKQRDDEYNRRFSELVKVMQASTGGVSFGKAPNESRPTQMWRPYGGGRSGNQCYYCWAPDHIARNCEQQHAHIAKGKIKLDGTQPRLADGSNIPFDGSRPPSERVDAYYAPKTMYMGGPVSDYGPGMYNIANTQGSPFALHYNKQEEVERQHLMEMDNARWQNATIANSQLPAMHPVAMMGSQPFGQQPVALHNNSIRKEQITTPLMTVGGLQPQLVHQLPVQTVPQVPGNNLPDYQSLIEKITARDHEMEQLKGQIAKLSSVPGSAPDQSGF